MHFGHGSSRSIPNRNLTKEEREMASICLSSMFLPLDEKSGTFCTIKSVFPNICLFHSRENKKTLQIRCETSKSGVNKNPKNRMEEYNIAMKQMMKSPYEYHHDLGMNYTPILDNLIVGSQPQQPEDIDYLKQEEDVAYILNLQQDKDIEYWGIDIQSILQQCREVGIRHMRRPVKDFDGDSLRTQLPKAVSSLEWAISEGKGKVYVHCTAGLGRAPAVSIAYMFWFCGMNLNKAYDMLTSKRPCGPNKRAIQEATYNLAKSEHGIEPFDSLPEDAFQGIAEWERKLIQERVRSLRGT